MEEGLGAKFWLWLAGVLIGGAVVLFIVLMFITRAMYAWGFFGALLALGVVCAGFAWWFDRRNKQRLDWDEENPEPREGSVPSDHMERF
jgi:hypothetical protein